MLRMLQMELFDQVALRPTLHASDTGKCAGAGVLRRHQQGILAIDQASTNSDQDECVGCDDWSSFKDRE